MCEKSGISLFGKRGNRWWGQLSRVRCSHVFPMYDSLKPSEIYQPGKKNRETKAQLGAAPESVCVRLQ